MADTEDSSPTVKAPRVGKEQADPTIFFADTEPLPDETKQRMRDLATEKRPAFMPDTPEVAPAAQPQPWWLQARTGDLAPLSPAPPPSEFIPDPINPFTKGGLAAAAPGGAGIIPPPAWVLAAQQLDASNDADDPESGADQPPAEEDMAQHQWEYCRVQLDAGMYGKQQTVARYPYYVRATIDYYGAEVPPAANFSEDSDQAEHANKVWGRILGQLGQGNWEMINVYLGGAKDFAISNVMAYFKRPALADRRVNEPKVTL